MFNIEKQIIYIGKAKNLKKRLTNYVKLNIKGRIARMVSQVYSVEYKITGSEAEALLIEAQLIRKHGPRFNILLRSDKSFPYIKINFEHEYPQLKKYRGKDITDKGIFGPYLSSSRADETINELQKIFKLRSCTDYYMKTRERACLQYEIRRCSGPCVGNISQEEYQDSVNQVQDFLLGKTKELQKKLSDQMENLSHNLLFEEAAIIRDKIKSLRDIKLGEDQSYEGIGDADIIVIVEKEGLSCIQVYLYRGSRAWDNKIYFPRHTEDTKKCEVIDAFIGQFYQTRFPAKEILTNHKLNNPKLIVKALTDLYGIKVKIISRNQGEKLALIEHATLNTQINLEQHLTNLKANSS